MDYKEFKNEFDKLTKSKKVILYHMIYFMEHKIDETTAKESGFNFVRGFAMARLEKEMTADKLYKEIAKRDNMNNEDSVASVPETFRSMERRSSKGSHLYKKALEILEIDEQYLIDNSEYYYNKQFDFEWLYDTLLPRDKEAVIFLLRYLLDTKRVEEILLSEVNNIGLEENDMFFE